MEQQSAPAFTDQYLREHPGVRFTDKQLKKLYEQHTGQGLASAGTIRKHLLQGFEKGIYERFPTHPLTYSFPGNGQSATASSPPQQNTINGSRPRKNWDGKSNDRRLRELADKKRRSGGNYAELINFQQRLSRMSVILEDYDMIKDFGPEDENWWVISDVFDDLITLGEWHDRALSEIQQWLESFDVRGKIILLRNTNGRTSEETKTALRLADKLERKLGDKAELRDRKEVLRWPTITSTTTSAICKGWGKYTTADQMISAPA